MNPQREAEATAEDKEWYNPYLESEDYENGRGDEIRRYVESLTPEERAARSARRAVEAAKWDAEKKAERDARRAAAPAKWEAAWKAARSAAMAKWDAEKAERRRLVLAAKNGGAVDNRKWIAFCGFGHEISATVFNNTESAIAYSLKNRDHNVFLMVPSTDGTCSIMSGREFYRNGVYHPPPPELNL